MATDKKQVEIPGRLHSVATEGVVAGANEILDDNKGKNQQEINASVDDSLQENKTDIANEITRATNAENAIKGGSSKSIQNLDSRLSTVEAHDTISMEGGSVVVGTAEDFTNRTTAGDAKIPTVGAILNGADEEPTADSNNLVKSKGVKNELALGAVYDVSAKNPTAGPNNDGKFESLYALLTDANLSTLIPTSVRKGGMSIKFVQSSDNSYVQFRYMSSSTAVADFTNVANWQGVDDVITPNSQNLASSNGVAFEHALQNIVVAKCSIQSTTWSSGSDRYHIVIPVNGGEHVEWSGDSILYYAMLTNYPKFPQNGDVPAFLDGYTGRQTSSSPFNIPSGCKYLIINMPSIYTNIIINGKSIIGGLWAALLQKINQHGIEDGAVTLAKLANDVVGGGLEHIDYKKGEITRGTPIVSASDYINKRALYEEKLNIEGGLDMNGFRNLFVPKYQNPNMGTPPTQDGVVGSVYDSTQFITIQQGHTYQYQLYASSDVYIIAEYDTNDTLISASSLKGTGSFKAGTYIPSATAVKIVLCNDGRQNPYPAFADITNNVYAFKDYVDNLKNELDEDIEDLQNSAVLDSDLTIEIVSKNIANPTNVMFGLVDDAGNKPSGDPTSSWRAIMIPVTAGQVISFGGFYLGRLGYAVFYNGDTKIGNRIQYNDPDGGALSTTQNITVPQGATEFYIDIQTGQSTIPIGDTTPYDHLMVNIGSTLLPYEPFEQKISRINGIEISGVDETLEPRVTALEGTVSQQGDAITSLDSRVTTIENVSIIEDLPVSDGTDISVGYAYIDSTTGIVKVKMN